MVLVTVLFEGAEISILRGGRRFFLGGQKSKVSGGYTSRARLFRRFFEIQTQSRHPTCFIFSPRPGKPVAGPALVCSGVVEKAWPCSRSNSTVHRCCRLWVLRVGRRKARLRNRKKLVFPTHSKMRDQKVSCVDMGM